MKKYIRIMRLDHWIKQLFILPGIVFGIVLSRSVISSELIIRMIRGVIAACFIASSNYVINEWLDAAFDKYHPVKKHRSAVESSMDKRIVYALYLFLAVVGFIIGSFSKSVLLILVWLWIMGIIYNVKPLRTKDIAFVDVLTESINNAIRLLIGWFIVVDSYFPPVSIVTGYWLAGAFLMAIKRFAEYRMINDPEIAGLYRKSFKHYSSRSLLASSFFYGMSSTLFIGIFLIKYRVELILFMPFLIGLFCYYFWIAFKEDSAVQKPEKLFTEKGLMIYTLLLCGLFLLLMLIRIPALSIFTSEQLIPIK